VHTPLTNHKPQTPCCPPAFRRLPTLAGGAAGLPLQASGRACPTCNRTVAPFDGVDQWPMLSTGAASARTEALLDLQATACVAGAGEACDVPGSGAIRVGKWKLLHGHTGVWSGRLSGVGDRATCNKCSGCVARANVAAAGHPIPFAIPANASYPWCPFGWTPPPQAGALWQLPRPAPELVAAGNCTSPVTASEPCPMPAAAGYLAGHTMLFDVVGDMAEEHDVAAANPDVVAKLLARLQQFNSSHCAGQRCLPDNAGGPKGAPTKGAPAMPEQAVWLPWRGDPLPAKCDTDRTPPTPTPPPPTPPTPPTPPAPACAGAEHCLVGTAGRGYSISGQRVTGAGWCFDRAWAGGGVPPMTVQLSVDGKPAATLVANVTRTGLPAKTGAPNAEHGFDLSGLSGSWVEVLGGAGKHQLALDVFLSPNPANPHTTNRTAALKGSPLCFADGKLATC
jgi:hypothetical protein